MKRLLPAMALCILAMGAGPCDLFEQPEVADAGDAGLDCGDEVCASVLVVEVIRADNYIFFEGVYNFEVSTYEGAQYSLECLFNGYGTSFECPYGDLAMMTAYMDSGAETIEIRLLDTPTTANFVVKYNDLAIGERSFTPMYEEISPNGSECEPVCYQAEETMAVESW